ncbi:TetR/AcrR family transcriptional regulator [Actinomadura sp. DC4]|uniref:TetR/AcrR family transcriptional regulator n=1 Tax=Actinomadura sp. DC4 TaxID=3055069 RepID=UPI0025B19FB0|nr:TetR/AcrR family transcriptional regulator [Actinomadura sp. DC4]MDN3351312.1 TetR family transcriptional regulator [Actinomadura sp. DC4]
MPGDSEVEMGEQSIERAPTRVRKDHDERRAQILTCARALFRERPYEAVSNTEIAAAAGVSRGLLNHYFGTKRELYLAAVEQMLHVPPIPVPAYVPGASVRDRVAESIDGWLELLERNAETWLAAVERASSGGDPRLGSLLDEARERAVDRINEVVGVGALAARHPEVRAVLRGYSGLAEAVSLEWLKRGRLTRQQAQLLLEETLLHITLDVLPRLVGEPAR